MAQINPHINFNGNAEEAFTFYKSVFGGEFARTIRFKDFATPEFPVAEKEGNMIMHIASPIGTGLLMRKDLSESMGRTYENRSKISVCVENKGEAIALFDGFLIDGQVEVSIPEALKLHVSLCFEANMESNGLSSFNLKNK